MENLLSLAEISKSFAGVAVLNGVSVSLHRGEVHALVGGNGAGKSTLMKIVTGLYRADSGKMLVKGKRVNFSGPNEAHQQGIYLVPQEPLIFPNMTVEENILIGIPGKPNVLKEKVRTILNRLGWGLSLQESAGSLAIAEQQLLEIMRGLVREAEILILDEPTSTLTFGEISALFQCIEKLTEQGLGVFYITHRMSEIFMLADTVTVLRDGKVSAQGRISQFTHETLLQGLLPEGVQHKKLDHRYVTELFSKVAVLDVQKATGNRFSSLSFSLYPGEIVGLAGVVGAGRTELAEALIGISSLTSGVIKLEGRDLLGLSIRARMDMGLVYVPEDRHANGIFSIAALKKNISASLLHRLKGLFLPFKKEDNLARTYMEELNIKTNGLEQELKDLSGGNQQKVVLSKYLALSPKVIILDEPTRGIDASARMDIYRSIMDLKSKGMAVMLISSDIEEIEKLSDRVLIMKEGKLVDTLQKKDISSNNITKSAFGLRNEVPS